MSADLHWLLLRKWNSFQHPGVKGGPTLSKEHGNLRNIHSHKYSGLSNHNSVSIFADKNGAITFTKLKKDVAPNKVRDARSSSTLRRTTGSRRANKIAAVETAGKGYRADLRQAAVARISALSRANARTAAPRKEFPAKTRGKKSVSGGSKAQSGKKEDDDVIELD
ncbi:ribosomal L28e protein family-domain-containing protein [Kockovaella imperatae]|uniref:Ribosomal L28e protein family-domain-containing protein n=1 Tax=Kockovaella imperatae TaxID=4999 RepID=A0A1Y1U5T7_9TREE|nr:ribosomal L28e protein family-domain-containing protein [Kockovaella imperatae]ORX33388.1 ribosomal L28e protein family-domain-containing protein [Kockovaella imperatae]